MDVIYNHLLVHYRLQTYYNMFTMGKIKETILIAVQILLLKLCTISYSTNENYVCR